MPKTTGSRPSVKPKTTPQNTTTKRARKQLTSGPTHSRHVAMRAVTTRADDNRLGPLEDEPDLIDRMCDMMGVALARSCSKKTAEQW